MAAQAATVEKYKEQIAETQEKLQAIGITRESLSEDALQALDELAEIGMALNVDPVGVDILTIAKAVSDEVDRQYDMNIRLLQMKNMHATLERELGSMRALESQLEQVQHEQEAQEDMVDEKMSEWTRGIKLLQAKTEEYESRAPKMLVQFPILYIW